MTIREVASNPATLVVRASSAVSPASPVNPKATAAPVPQIAAANIDQVQNAVRQVATVVQSRASNLKFSVDEETGTTVVKVIDAETNDVIRQIPSEEMLAIVRSLDKLAGLLLKRQA